MIVRRLRSSSATLILLLLIALTYIGQLVVAGRVTGDGAYTVARSLSTEAYIVLAPWLHSTHQHVAENVLVFVLLGIWTERRVGSFQFLVVVLATGYLTNLGPAVLGFGGLSVGASGITNALWANFTASKFHEYNASVQENVLDLRRVTLNVALGVVGLFFVLRSVAEFIGYLSASSGTATGAHLFGVVIGFAWFGYQVVMALTAGHSERPN